MTFPLHQHLGILGNQYVWCLQLKYVWLISISKPSMRAMFILILSAPLKCVNWFQFVNHILLWTSFRTSNLLICFRQKIEKIKAWCSISKASFGLSGRISGLVMDLIWLYLRLLSTNMYNSLIEVEGSLHTNVIEELIELLYLFSRVALWVFSGFHFTQWKLLRN